MKRVSVVIPSWNTRELLLEALASLEGGSEPPLEVFVIDNASHDGSARAVRERFPRAHLIENRENLGYTRATDQGIEGARGAFVLLLNADARLAPDALERMATFLETHPGYSAVAPRLLNPDGSLQRSVMRFPTLATPLFFATPLERWLPTSGEIARYFARDFDYERDADVEQPAAACLLVRAKTLQALGGLDERLWLFFSDVDLCRRLWKAGGRIRYLADARVVHHLGRSTGQHEDFLGRWHQDRLTYYRAHHGRLAGAWVKACVLFAYVDFVLRAVAMTLGGKRCDTFRPVTRSFFAFVRA